MKFIIDLPVIYLTRSSTMLKGKNKQTNKQTHQLVRLSNKLKQETKAARLHSASRHSMVDTEVPVHSSHIQCYVAKSVETWEHQLPPCAACLFDLYQNSREQRQSKIRGHAEFVNSVDGHHF